MEPKTDKNWVLYFGVGLLWAILTARKAYAPNINIDQITEVPDDIDGGNCKSTLGPQGIEFNGECYKCPTKYLVAGVPPASEADRECGRRGLSRAIPMV